MAQGKDRLHCPPSLAIVKRQIWGHSLGCFRPRISGLPAAVLLVAALAPFHAGLALDRVEFKVSTVEKDVDAAVRGASVLLPLAPGETDPDEVLAAARAEYGRLVGSLYAQGHYSPVISIRIDGREAAEISPLDSPSVVRTVEVTVDPGPKFVFSRARIAPLAPGTQLPKGFAPAQIAQSGLIASAAAAAVDGWRAKGHAKATVSGQEITADHRANTLDTSIAISQGPRLRFGAVRIEGNQRTRENRVRQIAGIPEGRPFDPKVLARAAERLRKTGTFRSVSIAEDELITRPDLLGLTVSVVEEKKRRLTFGAEVSSLEGLDLTASWVHRNLLGGAERLKIEGEIANIGGANNGIDYLLGLQLDRPATFTADTTLRLATDLAHIDDPALRADGFDLKLGVTHDFSDTLTGRVDLGYEYVSGTVFAIDGTRIGTFRNKALTLPVGLTWDKRDNATNAKRGFYVDAEVKPFLGFDSTGSGARLYADLRGYRDFGAESRFVIAGRLQVGAVLGPELLATPRDDLFLSGGGGTVRGQPYQSLGINVARGATSFLVGGNRFLAASVEARAKVTDSIGVVGFVDAGSIGLGDFTGSNSAWHAGAGVGLRYDTGVGPIRLDVAGPIGGKTGKGVQIYVGLGQAF